MPLVVLIAVGENTPSAAVAILTVRQFAFVS
jgi:hypothetical protein